MASFKKTNIKVFTKVGPELTPDNIYWKKYTVSRISTDLKDSTISFVASLQQIYFFRAFDVARV